MKEEINVTQRTWVTPSFEKQPLKDALAGGINAPQPLDGVAAYS